MKNSLMTLAAAVALGFALPVQAAPDAAAAQALAKDNGCTKCHATKDGGKIEGFNKDKAHALCQTCHKDGKKGPTKCVECHAKKK